MAMMSTGRLYLEQLLKTATKGNVTVTYALAIDRMQLHCHMCGVTLTAIEMTDSNATALDYSVQEFIRIHSHVGGHNDKPKCNCAVFVDAQSWRHETHCPKYAPPPTPVTADFKAVEKKAIESLGKIDEFPNVDEEKIKSQLAAYNKEAAEKMADAALAKKIAELQEQGSTESAGKYLTSQKIWKSEWSNSWTNEWDQYPKAKEQALKNILALQMLGKYTTASNTTQQLVPEPQKKEKLKPLKIATGRKFR